MYCVVQRFGESQVEIVLSVFSGGGGRIRTFEAYARDLQSPPFGRSGTPPQKRMHSTQYLACRQASWMLIHNQKQ